MIHCPNCNISFTPDCHACPTCHDFIPPLEDRVEFLGQKARQLANEGGTRPDVLDYLASNGLSHIDADDIVEREFSAVAHENRSYALKQLVGGLLCILVGIPGSVITPAVLVAGVWVFLLGLYSLITGKS